MKPSLAPYLLIALFLLLLFVCLAESHAAATARYQMIRIDNAGWFWTWHADKPYTTIRELCWDDAANDFCEPSLSFSRMTWIYEVIDHANDTRTTIYRLRRGGCIAWAWHNDYGTDGNPHIALAELITCP